MKRYEFRAGCILMGWCPVEAAIELRTSIQTIIDLETGCMEEELQGAVVTRAAEVFQRHGVRLSASA